MFFRGSIAAFLLLALAGTGLAHAQDPPAQPAPAPDPIDGNIVEVLEEEGEFDTLIDAFETAGLLETLRTDQGPLTLFAPTDDAFDEMPEDEREQVLQNPEELQNLLAYHVVPAAAVASDELATAGQAESALGVPLEVEGDQDQLTVEGADVDDADLDAANGVVHSVDRVLTPSQAPEPPQPE